MPVSRPLVIACASARRKSDVIRFLLLPRHTGEDTGGGGQRRRCLRKDDLESADTFSVAFPLRPCGPPPPCDGGGRTSVKSAACRSSRASGRPAARQPRQAASPRWACA